MTTGGALLLLMLSCPPDQASLCAAIQQAERGDAVAMSEVGVIYESRQDYAHAFEWYSRAARARDAHALFRLGILYQEGWSVARDRAKGLDLLEQAAWLGSADAQHYLGLLYFQGERVPKSHVTSYAWLTIAAPKGAKYVRTRDIIEKHLSPEELAEARRLSFEWADRLIAEKTARK